MGSACHSPRWPWHRRKAGVRGIDELIEAVQAHTDYLHQSETLHQIRGRRVEQELALVFRDEVEKFVFQGLKGTGEKERVHRVDSPWRHQSLRSCGRRSCRLS